MKKKQYWSCGKDVLDASSFLRVVTHKLSKPLNRIELLERSIGLSASTPAIARQGLARNRAGLAGGETGLP